VSAQRAKPPERKFVVVDLENLVGCSPLAATKPMWTWALHALLRAVAITDDALVTIGVNPRLAFLCSEIAPHTRIVWGTGPNGADRRLIKELEDVGLIQRRFTEVVVASGDHAFLDSVVALNDAGIHTTVVALEGQLSTALRLAAKTVIWLPSPHLLGEAA
jgi:hypothetical protein